MLKRLKTFIRQPLSIIKQHREWSGGEFLCFLHKVQHLFDE